MPPWRPWPPPRCSAVRPSSFGPRTRTVCWWPAMIITVVTEEQQGTSTTITIRCRTCPTACGGSSSSSNSRQLKLGAGVKGTRRPWRGITNGSCSASWIGLLLPPPPRRMEGAGGWAMPCASLRMRLGWMPPPLLLPLVSVPVGALAPCEGGVDTCCGNWEIDFTARTTGDIA